MILQYLGRLREESDQTVISNLIRKGWVEHTLGPDETVVTPPSEAPMWAFRAAVEIDGSLAAVQAAITALPGNRRIVAQNKWDRSDVVMRNSRFVQVIANAVGWNNRKVENLFTSAVEITTEKLGA